MTLLLNAPDLPALLGGPPAFPQGLPLQRPVFPDQRRLERRISAILTSGQLTDGPTVRELEETAAQRLGVAAVVAVSSCTSGLILTLQALDVRGRVVMPSFTFAAGPHAVTWAGGEPAFADITTDTLCLDPQSAADCLSGATALSATHVYGTPSSVESLEQLASSRHLPLVFDSAHALGSRRRGVPIGGFGTAEVFSLSPTKVVVAGEGGLVATNDTALAQQLRWGRNYGNPGDYDCRFPGLNARMSELHAAVALHSMHTLDENVTRRNELVEIFWNALAGLPGVQRPVVESGDVSTYKDLTILIDRLHLGLTAKQVSAALGAEGIDTRRYFHPPVHRQQAYRHLPPRILPVTDSVSERVLSLPLWSHMEDAQILEVADVLLRIACHASRVRTALQPGQGSS